MFRNMIKNMKLDNEAVIMYDSELSCQICQVMLDPFVKEITNSDGLVYPKKIQTSLIKIKTNYSTSVLVVQKRIIIQISQYSY